MKKSELLQIPYMFAHGPTVIHSFKQALARGANCQAVTALIERELGVNWPDSRLSAETFETSTGLRTLDPDEPLQRGDVVVAGRKNATDPRTLHLAVITGDKTASGDNEIIHASGYAGQVVREGLQDLSRQKRYTRIYAIRRPQELERRPSGILVAGTIFTSNNLRC